MALILALTVLLMSSMVIAAILPYALANMDLAYADRRYFDALTVAESGAAFELNKINNSLTTRNYPPEFDTVPRTVLLPDNRSFSVSAQQLSYGLIQIQSAGTSGGISRTVRVNVAGRIVFNNGPRGWGWSILGLGTMSLSGSWNIEAGLPSGTIGSATIDSRIVFRGDFFLVGKNATASSPYDTSLRLPLVTFPTVESLANRLAIALTGESSTGQQGITWLSTHNDNGSIQDINGNPVALSSDKTLDDPEFNSVPNATIVLKNPYTDGRTANFYLEGIDLAGKAFTLFIGNRNGPVALWLCPSSLSTLPPATLEMGNLRFDVSDHTRFRIYQALRARSLTIVYEKNSAYYGDIYAYAGTASSGYHGAVSLTRKDNVGFLNGSVIAYTLNRSGGFATQTCARPAGDSPVVNVTDPIAFYSATPSWAEVQP